MKNAFRAIENLVFKALVVLLPTQLALHFWPDYAFVFGVKIDYLAPAFYLTDGLVVVLLLLWFSRNIKDIIRLISQHKKILFILFLLIFLNIKHSVIPEVSVFKWLKFIEFIFLAFYVLQNINLRKFMSIFNYFLISLIPSVFLGIYNLLTGKTFGSFFYFLGERSFDISTPGIALMQILGKDFLRPYGTFPHPNSLAGFFGVLILILIFGEFKKTGPAKIFAVLLTTLFIAASSLSACFGMAAAVAFGYLIKSEINKRKFARATFYGAVLISILFLFLSPRFSETNTLNSSAEERISLAVKSFRVLEAAPVFGTGLGNFIPSLVFYQAYNFSNQPVHNIFLLVLSETGLLISIAAFLLVDRFLKEIRIYHIKWFVPVLIFVLITGTLDHYWLTLQQNMLLISMLAGVSLRKK